MLKTFISLLIAHHYSQSAIFYSEPVYNNLNGITFNPQLKIARLQDNLKGSTNITSLILSKHIVVLYTLKTPGSAVTRKRVHWGQTPFQVNDDPEISQINK